MYDTGNIIVYEMYHAHKLPSLTAVQLLSKPKKNHKLQN